MPRYDYDLFVVGAGSGGVRAARIAARHGARVAIAESSRVGGTCVIRGCVPKKLLWHASHFAESFEDAVGYGWTLPEPPRFDWATLIANKDREIGRLEAIYTRNLQASGVEIFRSHARLAGPHTVVLDAERRDVSAETILIATGGRPNRHLDLPGHEFGFTSDEAFDLDTLPRSIVIAGGGYIGVEFAAIFAGLGVDVTIVYRGQELLSGFDGDLRAALHEAYQSKGIKVLCCTIFQHLEKMEDGVRAHLSEGGPLEAEAVMFALGRRPNIEALGLEEAGVALDKRGAIAVDETSRTNVPSIYAIGDVTGRVQLTPVAIREGHAFADTLYGSRPTRVNYDLIPTAVFSQPEIGTVGLTEDKARAQYRAVDVYTTRFRPLVATLSGREDRVMMKLIVDADTDKVLGCHLFGPEAGEMAQLVGIALQAGATKQTFDDTIAVHPTMAEELVTLREKSVSYIRDAAAE